MQNKIVPVEPSTEEISEGVAKMTMAYIDGVHVAIASTAAGFRTAGISIPKMSVYESEQNADQRARGLAVDRLRTMRRQLYGVAAE